MPSPTGPTTAGIGTHAPSSTPALDNGTHASSTHPHHSSPLTTATVRLASDAQPADSDSELESEFDFSDDSSELLESDTEEATAGGSEVVLVETPRKKKKKRDYFSILPATVLQAILARLPPFQMLVISELSRTFYNFVVLGQEMNEVWFKLVKTEEAEIKKRLEWYKLKKLEQEHRSVQMMRSFSNSSTSSNMSSSSYGGYGDENGTPISKQAKRLLVKKQEASGKTLSSGTTVKVMKRADRKKNWCKIYVDTILRGNGEDPLESLSQVGPASKKPEKFQTITLNEPLPQEHISDFRAEDKAEAERKDTREARTQAKIEKRMYYKMIRSKPKGKKAGQMDSASAKLNNTVPWRQPEWSADQQDGAEFY
ncbi:hypothetical protein EMPS_09117 [Entomortierella parvispora]|uniref:F-box domain-containing protein n=1 Tax=Entomortierella parvispora TaxID=205924 RepID=A0A9P3HHY4_9FUNG|nr:hypothetical protein EMPS_09117 [Entomortierella parvispora]